MIHHSGRYGHPPFRDFIYEAWIFPEKPLVFFETSGYNRSVFDVIFAKGVFAVISLLLLKQIAQLFLSIFLGWILQDPDPEAGGQPRFLPAVPLWRNAL